MKVLKFGGGCLKDSRCFKSASGIILGEEGRTAAVVSAISGLTDILDQGLQKALYSEKSVPKAIKAIREKFHQICEDTILDQGTRDTTMGSIAIRLEKLERLLYGVAYTGEITESLRAMIMSFGERMSALTLAGVITSRGGEGVAMASDQIGVITDESYRNATADLGEVDKRVGEALAPVLDRGAVPVVTGYFGCTREGRITTFGRNGSDYTAAVLAHALDAGRIDVWKDVEGFMTADPKIVGGAKRIKTLSYYEAAELSYFGAKILHPRTVEPLVEKKIPIRIRNILDPGSEGTRIVPGGYEKEDVIKSVTYNRDISVLRVQGPGVGYKPGIISEIGERLSGLGINIYSVITAQTCINLLLDSKDSKRSYQVLSKLKGGVIETVDVLDDRDLIAVVGEGLLTKRGLAARVFSAVADRDINVEMISAGASEVAYYFIVRDRDLETAVKAIHGEFFE